MSIDFATFDLTELAVLDADAPQGAHTPLLPIDLEDLLGKPGMEVTEPMCCSCVVINASNE
ncbi:hypothetical protein [Kitasatospora sp. NBC_01302]|uniref:hypothetical protein n=1 Tax=Kitasatospora sp. NBC_01302 TaxID=2903575 RepID=UPI002E150698|nr:hypothetical protein OG294_36725 [Kitasatospora sp. NBC_01302]